MFTIQITKKGPIFSGFTSRQLNTAMQGAVQELVERGEQRLDKMLNPRPAGVYLSIQQAKKGKYSTGYYASRIHGEAKNLHGIINDGGVIYGPWLEGVSSRNQTTR